MSSSLEKLEEDIASAKDDLKTAKDDLKTAKSARDIELNKLAMEYLIASKKHLAALTEERLLFLKQKPVSKSFTEADEDWIVSVTGINSNYQEWMRHSVDFPTGYVLDDAVFPRDGFQTAFEEISKVFHMANEAGRRVFLNLFLSDVVIRFNGVLRIFPELDISVENGAKKRKLGGKTDYTVGFGKDKDIFGKAPPRELHLVALEAKTSISESDFWQCVAETASLYKSRVDAHKTMKSVWGILSNATDWEFIHIDETGLLWRSSKFVIDLRRFEEAQILPVYRFIHYVVKRCFECCTPNHSRESSGDFSS